LLHCHAGCHRQDVIAALKARGLRPHSSSGPRVHWNEAIVNRDVDLQVRRRHAALSISAESKPGGPTLVRTYLDSRGIIIPPPSSLRFHPGLKHPNGSVWPGMVGLITRGADRTLIAIHRTFLARDGAGKAPVVANKMILGPYTGGAVRLGQGRGPLIVGEGIETVLSAMQLWGLAGWAALCANGMASLTVEGLPDAIVIAADNDPAGLRAAGDLHLRVTASGKRSRVLIPQEGFNDFNDVLRAAIGAKGAG
jgi:hypothetical protein